jgi:GT2 family glycosyltransferase
MGTLPAALLSIIVVSWNQPADVDRCVRSVLEHTTYRPLEVIVVDNGSTDGTAELVRNELPEARLIANEQNLGLAAARTEGMRAARGELLCLLDCDTYVTDNVIGRAAEVLLRRPEIGMIGAELCFPDGRRQRSAHRAMGIRLSLLEHLWLYRLLPRHRRGEVLLGLYWTEDREVEVDWLTGAFLMLRRQLLDQTGGPNPRLYPDDAEWGIRLTRAGHRILYAPEVGTVYHVGSVGVRWSGEEQQRAYHRAGIETYRELNGPLLVQCYRAAQLLGVSVRFLVYRAASALRPSEYYITQTATYRLLVDIYARPYAARKRWFRREATTGDNECARTQR